MKEMGKVALLLFVIPFTHAAAQGDDSSVRPGSRLRFVRIDALAEPGERLTYPSGRFESADSLSFLLRPDSAPGQQAISHDAARIPMRGIVSAEIFTGLARHPWIGAVTGLTLGAMTGYFVSDEGAPGGGLGTCYESPVEYCGRTASRPSNRAPVMSALTAAGAVAGALLGYSVKTERWTQIDVASLRLRFGVK